MGCLRPELLTENNMQSWAKIDPSIYSQCFLGMARSTEGWCQWCQSLEHTSEMCPGGPSMSWKCPWRAAFPPAVGGPSAKPVCLPVLCEDSKIQRCSAWVHKSKESLELLEAWTLSRSLLQNFSTNDVVTIRHSKDSNFFAVDYLAQSGCLFNGQESMN